MDLDFYEINTDFSGKHASTSGNSLLFYSKENLYQQALQKNDMLK